MGSALADLHRHLDGSLRLSTLHDMARQAQKAVPEDLAFAPGMGLEEALARFDFTLSLLQDPICVQRVAAEICEDAIEEGVSTLEIRFAPQLHKRGRIEEFVDAALEGIEGRAGLILCGLYGEPPAVLEKLVHVGGSRKGVVGIDLAGGPAPGAKFGLSDYRMPFRMAADRGLGRTVHAGEGRPAAEIRTAIEELGAQRIGHGTTLLEDDSIVDLVLSRGVTIEACVTSNLHTGAIASMDAHPIVTWLKRGVRVCICTDNTLLSWVDAPEEYRRVRAIEGMTDELLELATGYGHHAAFGSFTTDQVPVDEAFASLSL